eukprot:m.162456 g.162456  ORF g.162456 m.162456 type:complete len:253 (-) comp12193_c0_seq1:115-873(-)
MTMLLTMTLLMAAWAPSVARAVGGPPLSLFVWPDRWSAVQEIHLVSGNFSGAVQLGRVEYDAVRNWTREDQALIAGPSVNTSMTSNNMTEWFRGTDWYYMDWTTGICQYTDFGFGQVTTDFLINSAFPHQVGTTYIYTYLGPHETNSAIPVRGFVNTSFIHTDGSAGFGSPPGSSLFEYYVDSHGNGRRLRMPSTLSSDLMIELREFENNVTDAIDDLPSACHKSRARRWVGAPATPLAHRASVFANRRHTA